MNERILCLIFLCFSIAQVPGATGQDRMEDDILWYDAPANEWAHALPVGNGRMGAMVFGNPEKERIQLNEDSLWPGGAEWGNAKGTPEDLEEIRQLILDGKVHLADSLIVERFSYKSVSRSHQTMGDLYIDFGEADITDYRRSLNLDNATVTTTCRAGGYSVEQTVFASHADDVLVIHISTTNPAGLEFSVGMERPEDQGHQTASVVVRQNQLVMDGMVTQYGGKKFSEPAPIDHGVRFQAVLFPVLSGGEVTPEGGRIRITGATEATLLIVSATSFYHADYRHRNETVLGRLKGVPYAELLSRHIEDYRALYGRVTLDLKGAHLDHLPTSVRLARIKEGKADIDLEEKLFRFGRYLLISCSRPGTSPANLQGLWNEHILAPWNADYHLNINLQMNYWPAEVTNLGECHEPVFDLGDRLIERGKILAREQYGMEGAVVHHTTDLWATPWMRAATPFWGSWIHGGGWLSRHYREHFQYTLDTAFLRERAYPVLKALSAFYLDWLVEHPGGEGLLSVPETSPENSYLAADGKSAAVSAGAAMGYQIIQDVFGNTVEAAGILNVDPALVGQIETASKRLPDGLAIGLDGRLLEWDKPYEEPEKGHRHMSHLYALHPDDAITEADAELFAAAQKTIRYRLDHGGAGPGWSRAWIINFYARLLQGNEAHEHIRLFLQNSIYPNLMDIHPPFQIDGNFGYTAGIAEMLMQSHEGFIRILPALPDAWGSGDVKGLKARGNIEVDISWREGGNTWITLRSQRDQTVQVKYGSALADIPLKKDVPVAVAFHPQGKKE